MTDILIADHDAGFGKALQKCLIARGYDTCYVTNALECLDQLQSNAPLALVLDPAILWGGGCGVLEWMMHEQPIRNPRIVIVQSGEGGEIPDELVESFIHAIVHRPAKLKDLLHFVSQIETAAGLRQRSQQELAPENDNSASGQARGKESSVERR